jgi:hypothetical protein
MAEVVMPEGLHLADLVERLWGFTRNDQLTWPQRYGSYRWLADIRVLLQGEAKAEARPGCCEGRSGDC